MPVQASPTRRKTRPFAPSWWWWLRLRIVPVLRSRVEHPMRLDRGGL